MNYQNSSGDYAISMPQNSINIRAVLRLVYVWMGLGLLTTTIVAYFTANNPSLQRLVYQPGVLLVAIVAEIGLVIALSVGLNRKWLTPNLAAVLFFVYAALSGFTLSVIFLAFDIGDITNALATTVLLFGVMTIFGFTTQMDLTRWGTYLMMGLVALVIAMVVNIFLGSSTVEFIISAVGVLLFTALTAYDTQKIKLMTESYEIQSDGNLALKFSIIGALNLYLDFVNLFLFLLRLFGGGGRD